LYLKCIVPVLSKLFENSSQQEYNKYYMTNGLYQIEFRWQHTSIEQVHHVSNVIHTTMETNQYCTAAFLGISQAFDKVWHEGLLYKLKTLFPDSIYQILNSYLANRHLLIKYREAYTSLFAVLYGVSQASVLGPLLYLVYTADLPTTAESITATFADDTAILPS
jgi:hypothetical protein